ncbi:hypothetical protein BBJ28_00016420 [Nothophytophthora sp. Chile5]|nr:hypothetical protein BBJ28_00016420 [Nothophytophthora sp. Chile5]
MPTIASAPARPVTLEAKAMSFRSLLEAAMGDEELAADVQGAQSDATGHPADDVEMLDADAQARRSNEEDQQSDAEESDDAYVPLSSEDDDDEGEGADEEEEEDSDIERQVLQRRRGGPTGKRSVTATKVPPELANVLGEANMLYASHQYDEAITLLKDFIKKAPTIPDPYHTLGMIYEDRQDRTKALQFFLIACTLTPQDAELWKRVGRIAKDEKNFDQALFCFKKASSADPKDKEALFSYAELCREQGDNRRAAEVFKKLTVLIPKDLSLWIQIAEAYHCNEQEDEAVDALKMCIEKAAAVDPARNLLASKYELNAVNMLADLYITLKKYRDAINVIHQLHARYASAQDADQVEGDPGGLPLDIAVKYGICHLFERDFATAESMFAHLFAQDVEVFGDLYLDVADAYIVLGDQDRQAAEILQQLLGRDEFPVEQIWIKFAACHDRLGMYDVAVEYYEKALTHQRASSDLTVDPELMLKVMQATRKKKCPLQGIALLSEFLPETMRPPIRPYWINASRKSKARDAAAAREEEGNKPKGGESSETRPNDDSDAEEVEEEAEEDEEEDGEDRPRMEVAHDPSLSVDAMENGVRLKLLIEWGHLKKQAGEAEVLCQVGIPIILTSLSQTSFRLSGRVKNPLVEPRDVISASDAQSMGFQVLKSQYLVDITDVQQRESFMGIVMRVAQQIVISRALGEQLYYNLVIDVAETLTELGKYVAAIELLTDVNTSDKISKPTLRFELRFLALVIALEFKENRMAYECARLNIMEDPHNLGYWNLFARVIAITGVFSWHQKFLAKLLRDDPESYPAILLAGHQSSAWDIASLTVGELTLAHQKHPSDPLTLFCIGLAFLSASMQRTINDRQHTVAKAFAFLQQYERTRVAAPSDIVQDIRQIEAWYNIGRAHQQLGLFHLAIPMYERVLRFFEAAKKEQREVPKEYLLCRETAYNLSLIYKQSRVAQVALRQSANVPAVAQLARRSVLDHAVQQQQQRSYVVDPHHGAAVLTRNKYQSVLNEEFPLECGGSLPEIRVEWEQWGDCSLPGDRTILVLPSFSHSSHAASNRDDPRPGWWENMIGPGKAINTSYFRVICPSVLGSPFGATSPLSVNPLTGEKYKASFPQLTPADMARCHAKILDDLGIENVHTVIGASMGGIQALEFAAQFPDRLNRLVGLACTHQTTPGTVAFRRVQRRAILADPAYNDGNYIPGVPLEGMKVARELGMTCYRSREEFDARFDWNPTGPMHFKSATFEVESYMDYQANKFARLYDPNCYLLLSKAMDLTNLGRGSMNLADGTSRISCDSLVIGIKQDLLIPIQEQRNLVNILQSYGRDSQLVEVDSKFGHDSMFHGQMQLDVFSPLVREYIEEPLAAVLPHEQHRYSSL